MKTTYYFGDIDIGRYFDGFEDKVENSRPIAILNRIDVVMDFETPDQAWDFYCNSNGAYKAYISVDATDQLGVKYQLVFNKEPL